MVPFSNSARLSAATIAAITAIFLLIRVSLSTETQGSIGGAIVYLSQFFTILTNLLVMISMAWIASGRSVSSRLLIALVSGIVGVGLVYHALLAGLRELDGVELFVDHGVHTIVPASVLIWWLIFAERTRARASDLFIAIVWPLAYCIAALFRAEFSGFYPYPFLNLPKLGWGGLVQGLIGVAATFFILGIVLVTISHIAALQRERKAAR